MTAEEAISKAALAYLPATYKRALQYLAKNPSTTDQLAKHLGMTVGGGYGLVSTLRDLRVIAIVDYQKLTETGAVLKIWGLGEKHAKRPPRLTSAQRSARWRNKKAALNGTVKLGIWNL